MCVMGRGMAQRGGGRGAEEMEWGSYYLGKVFEEWPGKVRRPWNGTPLLLLSTLTTEYNRTVAEEQYYIEQIQ